MVTTEGNAIPMTVAVGNHESGQESWGDQLSPSKVTSFFDLFAQEEDGNKVRHYPTSFYLNSRPRLIKRVSRPSL